LASLATFYTNEGYHTLIKVDPMPEPANFNAKVRVPGKAFLTQVPNPTSKEFRKNNFWKATLQDLKTAYGSICAYSCIWIPGNCSVDHFVPKSARPDLAYEWDNYRLAHDRINSKKADSTDVLDPFRIQAGWFILDFATLFLYPEASLQSNIKGAVQRTIDILSLNDDPWVKMRFEILKSYLDGELKISFLQRNYPFIAAEIQRQSILPK
jgi:hypothetical protein